MNPTPTRARLVELLATEATQKLTADERNELATLLRAFPDEDSDALGLAAAAVDLAVSGPPGKLPKALAEKLYVASGVLTPSAPATPARAPAKPQKRAERRKAPAWVAWSGWGVAASFAAVAVFALARPPKEVEKIVVQKVEVPVPFPVVEWKEKIIYVDPTPAVVKATVEKDPKAVRFVEAKGGITANVVWSESKQDGVLEVRGLPANDPKKDQYQLWVFDKTRGPDPKPISVGVFDVKPDGTAMVRVNASLRIDSAAAFAISQEPPGGLEKPSKVVMVIPPKAG